MSNYLSFIVIRTSSMSIIACDFNDFESVDQSLAAILINGSHDQQGANLRWSNIRLRSQDIYQHICQVWCLYYKRNNWFVTLRHAAPVSLILLIGPAQVHFRLLTCSTTFVTLSFLLPKRLVLSVPVYDVLHPALYFSLCGC